MSRTPANAPDADSDGMNLFIRRFPADLHRRLKVSAAKADRDLREEVIERLRLGLNAKTPAAAAAPAEAT